MIHTIEQIRERLTLKRGVKNTIDEDMLSYVMMCVKAMRGIDRDNAVFVTGSGGVRGVITRLELHLAKQEREHDELLAALKDCREALRRADADGELKVVDAAIAKATGGGA